MKLSFDLSANVPGADFALKMMNSALTMLDCALKMMNCVLK